MKKNLKKILLLVLVVLTCGFVSCKTINKTRKTLNIKENANFMRVNKVVYPESKNSNEANGQKFITILKKFTNSTTKEIFKSNQNEIYSPISLYFALAMLYEACDGESALELENLLSINDKDLLRKELKTVYTNNYYNNELGTSEIANSIWVNKAYEVNKEYAKILEENYFVDAFRTTFDYDSLEQICNWINYHTYDLLDMKPNQLLMDETTAFSLINTVYFENRWKEEMKKENIYKELFDNKNMVSYLTHRITSLYYENEMYIEAFDRYSNDCRVRYMLPKVGYTVDDLLNSDIFLENVLYNGADVIVSVPKFEVTSELDIMSSLKALGISNIFDKHKASINALYGENAFVSGIKQNAKVIFDENGTKAAAVTSITNECTSAPIEKLIELTLDHPFLYVIYDANNLPLFVGVIRNL
mgnify:CR=1 FL=1